MSQSNLRHRGGDGRAGRLASLGAKWWRERSMRTLMCTALLVTIALPAWSARVRDVRVGKHPTFTRVVFELDRPAGYKLERHSPTAGVSELVVSLDAAAADELLRVPKQKLVDGVTVESQGGRSVVRIQLGQAGLRLKEMTLSQPSRIVLDVLAKDVPKQAAKPATKPAAKLTVTASSAATKAAQEAKAAVAANPMGSSDLEKTDCKAMEPIFKKYTKKKK